ncbi:hypothetical protein L1887_35262 [Cichorium endivia]|nr:hypothetical protein L1887_35262 [Cichorium endivia]
MERKERSKSQVQVASKHRKGLNEVNAQRKWMRMNKWMDPGKNRKFFWEKSQSSSIVETDRCLSAVLHQRSRRRQIAKRKKKTKMKKTKGDGCGVGDGNGLEKLFITALSAAKLFHLPKFCSRGSNLALSVSFFTINGSGGISRWSVIEFRSGGYVSRSVIEKSDTSTVDFRKEYSSITFKFSEVSILIGRR